MQLISDISKPDLSSTKETRNNEMFKDNNPISWNRII